MLSVNLRSLDRSSGGVTHRSVPTVTVVSLTEVPVGSKNFCIFKVVFPYPCLSAQASSTACMTGSQVSGFHVVEVVLICFYEILPSHLQQDKQEAESSKVT